MKLVWHFPFQGALIHGEMLMATLKTVEMPEEMIE